MKKRRPNSPHKAEELNIFVLLYFGMRLINGDTMFDIQNVYVLEKSAVCVALYHLVEEEIFFKYSLYISIFLIRYFVLTYSR